jgi:alpha-galactosidase
MKFVLWLEPERVSANSRIAREHPEWVLHAGPGDGLFNLGHPAARAWLTDYLSTCFKEWGVDVFRMDFNIDPLRFWKTADAPERQGISEIRYVEGLYELWDELVHRQPGLTIDNCASGGRRIDLETVSRSYPLWRSDAGCASGHAEWDQIQVAGLSLYVPQHTGGVWDDDPYTFRSAATMGVSLCWDARDPGRSLARTRAALDEVKQLRPLYLGNYYPVFPITQRADTWAGWQFDRPDLGKGFVTLLRRPDCPYASAELKLRDLAPQAKYELEVRPTYEPAQKQVVSGAELARWHVQLPARGSTLLVYRKLAD